MPTARATLVQVKGSHLIAESIGDEVVVYNRQTNHAHLLDHRASAVWGAAENGCSMDAVVELVEGKTVEERRFVAQIAIADLERAGLVTSTAPAIPRRRALVALGGAAALPMVISILAPSPAVAATNLAPGAPCTQDVDFCKTPFDGKVFYCQDPFGAHGFNEGRCCPDEPTRKDIQLMGGVCLDFKDCCSFSDCVGGFCVKDF